jgi:hypothetical protein
MPKNAKAPVATEPKVTVYGNNNFQPTFRKYNDMSEGEKAAFRQGAKTSENKVKEKLGFTRPKK